MRVLVLNIVLVLLCCPVFYGQGKEDNSEFKSYSSSVFNSKEAAMTVVSGLNKQAQNNLNLKLQSGIQIQQIGDLNKVNATLKSSQSKVYVEQNGDGNNVLIDKNGKSIVQSVLQQGDNNRLFDFTYKTNYDINMEIVQKGDNQNIQNIGTNSLSKNMKITQTGNGASVILINKL
ncbi:hypothetical protein [Flavobacterium anhuiense]|uniref:hypothetical protein n=1 Tax=Flavobacterium anhuiense TaxID=459526 RepID=UPI003D955ACC